MSAQQLPTALLDAMIARNLQGVPPDVASTATPLEGFPELPNPDPNSAPPLYGEPPGEGYLYARDPETRLRAMVHTDADTVRNMLLRAIETAAQNSLLPFAEVDVEKQAKAALAFSQAYLLLDPSVDAEGVNVAHAAGVQAMGQMAVAAAAPQPAPTQGSSSGGSTAVKRSAPTGGHSEPPHVLGSQAAAMLEQMHGNAEAVLKGARGSRPLPRPRVNA